MTARSFSAFDELIVNFDQALRTLLGAPRVTARANPADGAAHSQLTDAERDHVGRLMRINHTGEVCAQGLYQGQALTARRRDVRDAMQESAHEENDHLAWCESRVLELGGRLSLLNPLFYAGSFALGAAAGIAGDRWSLGFVHETEDQVEGHLDEHLRQLPAGDHKTRAILEQMKSDEVAHGAKAKALGGADLPQPIRTAMGLTSKLMTRSVYYL